MEQFMLPLILVVFVVLMWFMSRNQKKRQQEAVAFRDRLAPGQEVLTIGRLVGTITDVDGDIITIETTPGTSFRVEKNGIAKLIEPPVEEDDEVDLDPGDKADTINLNGKDVPRSQIEGAEPEFGEMADRGSKGPKSIVDEKLDKSDKDEKSALDSSDKKDDEGK